MDAMTVKRRSSAMGALMGVSEAAIGVLWSLGEMTQAALRPGELGPDPHLTEVLDDIERRGFYVEPSAEDLALRLRRGGWIVGRNPYPRIASPSRVERVVAGFAPAGLEPTRTLAVVCHCYGVPSRRIMRTLFGLRDAPVDIAINIAPHHYRGSFDGWPGAGFSRMRMSVFIENIRAAVTGAMTLIDGLVAARGYERVVVVGYSLGGQIALHLCNTGRIDGALLYCPVTSLRKAATAIGVMPYIERPVDALLRRVSGMGFACLDVTEALRYPMQTASEDVYVIAQRYDRYTPPEHVLDIQRVYPAVRYTELPGTHIYPADLRSVRAHVRELVGF